MFYSYGLNLHCTLLLIFQTIIDYWFVAIKKAYVDQKSLVLCQPFKKAMNHVFGGRNNQMNFVFTVTSTSKIYECKSIRQKNSKSFCIHLYYSSHVRSNPEIYLILSLIFYIIECVCFKITIFTNVHKTTRLNFCKMWHGIYY
jgi:hypothetical protein